MLNIIIWPQSTVSIPFSWKLPLHWKFIFRSNYPFLRAAIGNDWKLGGLKKQKFIFSQFWRPAKSVSLGPNQSAVGPMLPLDRLGETPLLAFSSCWECCLRGCITSISGFLVAFPSPLRSSSTLPQPSLIRTLEIEIRKLVTLVTPTWIIWENLPISRSSM